MGPNSFRNLTYAAVLTVVGALVYLIYKSSKDKQAKAKAATEQASTLGNYSDTLGGISSSSSALPSAALASDTVHNAVDGQYLASPAAAKGSKTAVKGNSEVKDVTVEDPTMLTSSASKKKTPTSASTAVKPKSPAKKVKFNPGEKGDFMVLAGSFASKDNADALVAKLKKLGFTKAEGVKFESSANTQVVAGYYGFKGGADAAIRTLKKSKIDAILKKRMGTIYKAQPAPLSKPSSPAAKPAAAPSKPS